MHTGGGHDTLTAITACHKPTPAFRSSVQTITSPVTMDIHWTCCNHGDHHSPSLYMQVETRDRV